MEYVYYILILGIVGLAVLAGWLWKLKKENEEELARVEKEKDEYEKLGQGLAEYNQKLQEKKAKAKEKILEIFGKKTRVSNKDVAKALDISSATARRYFDELEREGKVKQVGKVGKNVYYSKYRYAK